MFLKRKKDRENLSSRDIRNPYKKKSEDWKKSGN